MGSEHSMTILSLFSIICGSSNSGACHYITPKKGEKKNKKSIGKSTKYRRMEV